MIWSYSSLKDWIPYFPCDQFCFSLENHYLNYLLYGVSIFSPMLYRIYLTFIISNIQIISCLEWSPCLIGGWINCKLMKKLKYSMVLKASSDLLKISTIIFLMKTTEQQQLPLLYNIWEMSGARVVVFIVLTFSMFCWWWIQFCSSLFVFKVFKNI